MILSGLCFKETFLFTLGLLVWLQTSFCDTDDVLEFAHVVWRHGDRSPIHQTFPTDVKNGPETWPEGFGELTTLGMRQHYQLGEWLKERYLRLNLISTEYRQAEIYIQSTDYNRTIMSALSNLAGFYSADGNVTFQANLSWSPVPVHSTPVELLLWQNMSCPVASRIEDEFDSFPEVKQLFNRFQDLITMLNVETGWQVDTAKNVSVIHDILTCERSHPDTHKMPDWVDESRYQRILEFYEAAKLVQSNTAWTRLRGGPLLGEILDRMDARAQKKWDTISRQLRYVVYSGHDDTLLALLTSLEVFNGRRLPYAAAFLIELYRTRNNSYHVQLWYQNSTESPLPFAEPFKLDIPKCRYPCSLDTLMKLRETQVPQDWHRECGLLTSNSFYHDLHFWKHLAVGCAIASTALAVLLIGAIIRLMINIPHSGDTVRRYKVLSMDREQDEIALTDYAD